jgi:hypothetical protein
MGEITTSKLAKYAVGDVLVETGTYYGGTINVALRSGFKTIHTIEISEYFATRAKTEYNNIDGVHIHHGDSPDILKTICPTLTVPATFWLDGHYMGAPTGTSKKYGDCPLLEELSSINMSPCKNHVIMIDDCRLLGTSSLYPTTIQVTNALFEINRDYRIFYIHGYEKNEHRDNLVHPYDIMVATTFIET